MSNITTDKTVDETAAAMLENAKLTVQVDANDIIKQARQTFGWAPGWFEKAAWCAGGVGFGALSMGTVWAGVSYFA